MNARDDTSISHNKNIVSAFPEYFRKAIQITAIEQNNDKDRIAKYAKDNFGNIA
jgi:hypothetical protein